MKKYFRFFFFLMLTAGIFLAACKKEPDLPADPHVPLVNPFIGVWKTEKGEYWQFRPNGTGGKAATATGTFPDNFSFFVYAGQDVQTAPSSGKLIMVYDDAVTIYQFYIWGTDVYLEELVLEGYNLKTKPNSELELERISGSPQVLNLNNRLIGEWSANWNSEHGLTWSLKYREDGTLKAFHHEVGHQFENAYVLRENKLVILGDMRFFASVTAIISDTGNGTLQVTETQAYPPPTEWTYTKVEAAEWK